MLDYTEKKRAMPLALSLSLIETARKKLDRFILSGDIDALSEANFALDFACSEIDKLEIELENDDA